MKVLHKWFCVIWVLNYILHRKIWYTVNVWHSRTHSPLGTAVSCVIAQCPNSFHYWPIFLLICNLHGNNWWIKYLDHCYLHWWFKLSFRLLFLKDPAPGLAFIWEVNCHWHASALPFLKLTCFLQMNTYRLVSVTKQMLHKIISDHK